MAKKPKTDNVVALPVPRFDYGEKSDAEEECERSREIIVNAMRTAVVIIGGELQKVKKRLGHGLFVRWLKHNFLMTPATAANYMNAARVLAENQNFSSLPPSALYLLAHAPAAVKEEINTRLGAGERLTFKHIGHIKAKMGKLQDMLDRNVIGENKRRVSYERTVEAGILLCDAYDKNDYEELIEMLEHCGCDVEKLFEALKEYLNGEIENG